MDQRLSRDFPDNADLQKLHARRQVAQDQIPDKGFRLPTCEHTGELTDASQQRKAHLPCGLPASTDDGMEFAGVAGAKRLCQMT